jgi:hypothetical protein
VLVREQPTDNGKHRDNRTNVKKYISGMTEKFAKIAKKVILTTSRHYSPQSSFVKTYQQKITVGT